MFQGSAEFSWQQLQEWFSQNYILLIFSHLAPISGVNTPLGVWSFSYFLFVCCCLLICYICIVYIIHICCYLLFGLIVSGLLPYLLFEYFKQVRCCLLICCCLLVCLLAYFLFSYLLLLNTICCYCCLLVLQLIDLLLRICL